MREIKFRVWDNSHKCFLPNEIYDLHNRTSFGSFGVIRKDWMNYSVGEYFYDTDQVLEQYTGLKDKNGVEIFEGDIVNVSGKPYLTEKATVVFGKKSFGFKIKCIVNDGYKNLYKYYGLESSSKLEVIGNIHETK